MAEPAQCQKLDADSIKNFLDSFDNVLTDCDGVLWAGSDAISGSPETIQFFKSLGKKVYYVTNNSMKTREEYVKKCASMGYPAEVEEIVGSAYVTAHYIKDVLKYNGKVYMIGSPGLQQEFDAVGIRHTGIGPDDLKHEDLPNLLDAPLDPEIKCVAVGYDFYFSYSKNLRAAAYLSNPDCHFIATNMDSGLPLKGRHIPGTGSIVASVEVGSQRKPTVCGKPNKPIFDVTMQKHNLNPARTLMIGDRLDTDIELAHNCGLTALFVLTGFSTMEEVQSCKNSGDPQLLNRVPHYYLDCLGDLVKLAQQAGVV